MLDRPSSRTDVDIATGARILGVSVEALRKRLQRGRVDGYKTDGGTWRVVLDIPGQPVEMAGDIAGTPGTGYDLADLHGAVAALRHDLIAVADALHELAIQVRDLRSEVERSAPPNDLGDAVASAVEATLRPALATLLQVLSKRPSSQGN